MHLFNIFYENLYFKILDTLSVGTVGWLAIRSQLLMLVY
jgi:hypothetical protein